MCPWVVCGGGCGGTLLGCRSTSPAPRFGVVVVGFFLGYRWGPLVGVVGGVGGLLFVNYIVDASIFERRAFYDCFLVAGFLSGCWWWGVVVGVWCVFLMIICVVWRISCYGHTVDALASGADEGRGNLRYASGS